MTRMYFATKSYRSQSADLADERLINAYMERGPEGGRDSVPVIGAPGVAGFVTPGVGPIYGAHAMQVAGNDVLYVVSGGGLYSVDSAGTVTFIGVIEGQQRCSMSDNGTQLVIVNGLYHYVYTVAGGLSKIALGLDSDFSISVSGAGPSSTEVTITLTGGPSTGANVNQIYVSLTADAGSAVVFSELPGDADTISDVATALAATIDAHAAFAATAVAGVITVTPDGGTTNLTAASGTAAIYQITFTVGDTFATDDIVTVDIEMTSESPATFGYKVLSTDTASTIASALQALLDGHSLLTATVSSNVVTVHATNEEITDADANQNWLTRNGASPRAKQVWHLDGYFIFPGINTQSFSLSNLNDGATILGTGSVTSAAGNIVSACVNQRQLVLLCQNFGEVWRNTGNADFPFERIPGAHIERGSAATYSIGKDDNSFAWLGEDRIVYGMAAGSYSPTRISTHGVEHQISTYDTIDDAFAFVISWKGHKFYVLTFPSVPKTWLYDVFTREWHERISYDAGTVGGDGSGGDGLNVGELDGGASGRGTGGGGAPGTAAHDLHTDCHFDTISYSSEMGMYLAGGLVTDEDTSSDAAILASSDGTLWWHEHLTAISDFIDIQWVSFLSLWIGTAGDGKLYTSQDGLTWTERTPDNVAQADWQAVSSSPELGLVACFDSISSASAGRGVITSPDGITWTSRNRPSGAVNGSAWSPELNIWVSVGNGTTSTRAMSSTDGITWTNRTTPAGPSGYNAVDWSPENSLFAAAGSGGIITSSNGTSWSVVAGYTDTYRAMKWAALLGLFVTVGDSGGSSGVILTSPDGVTWTSRSVTGLPATSIIWYDLAWNPESSQLVAIGRDNDYFVVIATSSDGITWTTQFYDDVGV